MTLCEVMKLNRCCCLAGLRHLAAPLADNANSVLGLMELRLLGCLDEPLGLTRGMIQIDEEAPYPEQDEQGKDILTGPVLF